MDKILFIEDEALTTKYLKRELSEQGFTVTITYDGDGLFKAD